MMLLERRAAMEELEMGKGITMKVRVGQRKERKEGTRKKGPKN